MIGRLIEGFFFLSAECHSIRPFTKGRDIQSASRKRNENLRTDARSRPPRVAKLRVTPWFDAKSDFDSPNDKTHNASPKKSKIKNTTNLSPTAYHSPTVYTHTPSPT
mmetsp:Transcript_368/g.828  ORF Transcript_368/g.828 Transcript_368/m.828 type:complete len:107 (-) Transcript_368:2125-2445(-)